MCTKGPGRWHVSCNACPHPLQVWTIKEMEGGLGREHEGTLTS